MASVLGVLLVAGGIASAGGERPDFDTDKDRYRHREMVVTKLHNDTDRTLRLTSEWSIREKGGPVRARMYWGEPLDEVAPGETRRWRWPQDFNDCGRPQGACTDVGGNVPPGRYEVQAELDGEKITRRFDIGRYFTLGFSRSSDEFILWANDERTIRRLTREARAEERTMIVSGVVRRERPYNPDWSYSMGPRSISLSETAPESCDQAPRYVEAHRAGWMGKRWCPWSGYVKRAGR
jgi:hypothetical protein